jgi:hypothetical protein
MNTLILINAIWVAGSESRGGVGVLRPSDVEDMLVGHPTGVTRYAVRKMFRDMREAGLIQFHGNHYTMNSHCDAMIDLTNAMALLEGAEFFGSASE